MADTNTKNKLEIALDIVLFIGMTLMLLTVSFIVLKKVFKPVSLFPLLPENTIYAEEWFTLTPENLEPIDDLINKQQKANLISYIKGTTLDETGEHQLVLLQLDSDYVRTIPQIMRKEIDQQIWYQKKLGRNTVLLTTTEQITNNTRSLSQNLQFNDAQQNSPRIYDGAVIINWDLVTKKLNRLQITTIPEQLFKNAIDGLSFTQISLAKETEHEPIIIAYTTLDDGKTLQPATELFTPKLLDKLPKQSTLRGSGLSSLTKFTSLFAPKDYLPATWLDQTLSGLNLSPTELSTITNILDREVGFYQLPLAAEQETAQTVFVIPYQNQAELNFMQAIFEKVHGYLNPRSETFALRDGGLGSILVPQARLALLQDSETTTHLEWEQNGALKSYYLQNMPEQKLLLLSSKQLNISEIPTSFSQSNLSPSSYQKQFLLHSDQVTLLNKQSINSVTKDLGEVLPLPESSLSRFLADFSKEELLLSTNQFLDGVQVSIFPN